VSSNEAFHSFQYDAFSLGGFLGHLWEWRGWVFFPSSTSRSRYLPHAVTMSASVRTSRKQRHSLRTGSCSSVLLMFLAKACMINWSYTLAPLRSGEMPLMSMFHLLHVSQGEVSQQSVTQPAICSNGMDIRLLGNPSSSRSASMDVVRNSPMCVADTSSPHNVSKWVSF